MPLVFDRIIYFRKNHTNILKENLSLSLMLYLVRELFIRVI